MYIEFFYSTLRTDLSLRAGKRQSHAAFKQTVTSKTIWSCVWRLSPLPPPPISSCTSPRLWWVILNPNRLLSHRPHHTVARLQPPGARRGLGAWCSISNGARGGWSRRGRGRPGVWVGTGPPPSSCVSSSSLSHNQTSFCSSPSLVNVHTVVCARMCVLTQYPWCYCVKSSFWSGPGQLSLYLHHKMKG